MDATHQMYFSTENLEKLKDGYSAIDAQRREVMDAFALRTFSNDMAREYAHHGFLRRVKTLHRCILNVYDLCPPTRTDKLSSNELSDLVINLQSFVFNVFGCMDNIAWIWVYERGISLSRKQIGLSKEYKKIRASFSPDFQLFLSNYDEWFKIVGELRHALAHRIPLYVPPYYVTTDEAKKLAELEEEKTKMLRQHRYDDYERLDEEIESIGTFVPHMTHSFSEKSEPFVFHAQLIADWSTVHSISIRFIKEL